VITSEDKEAGRRRGLHARGGARGDGGTLSALGHATRFPRQTDSRALGAGELFVAIRATRTTATPSSATRRRGAGAVVVEQPLERAAPGCGVSSSATRSRGSPLRPSIAAAAAARRRDHRYNGKTHKEMLAAILERAPGVGRVLRTRARRTTWSACR